MKKHLLLLLTLLLAMAPAASAKFVKHQVSHVEAGRQTDHDLTIYTEMNSVLATVYTAASASNGNKDNYYLILSDSNSATYDATSGDIVATDCSVATIDLYAPQSSGLTLPAGTYEKDGDGDYSFDSEYSATIAYSSMGKAGSEIEISGSVTVEKADDGTYTIKFTDKKGVNYRFTGTLSFTNSDSSDAVYPQISSDVNTTFTGGLAYYYGNLMESKTGNIYINLYDAGFNAETGGMTEVGYSVSFCAFNRLFGDSKTATIIPGTYTMARNFQVNTYYPGMEIDYMGITMVMGSYVKRRKAVTGNDDDYAYGYITDGTMTITAGEEDGTFDFVIDCVTDRGHKVKGTAKGIKFTIIDSSDDSDRDPVSNLTSDVALNLDYIKTARLYSLGEQNGTNVFVIDIGSPSGLDGNEGDLIRMEFQTATTETFPPTGTYSVMEYDHLYTNMYAPYRLTQGYFDSYGELIGTRYWHFEEGRYQVASLQAAMRSGTVSLSKADDDNYKFEINLFDGNGFIVAGNWTGPIADHTGVSDVEADASETMTFIDDNHIVVSGIADGSAIAIYSAYGQQVVSAKKTGAIDISALAPGVYIIKTAKNTIKFVKK